MTRKVVSDIAAVVSRIDVAPGAEVAQGDHLMTLEAMKMEIPVEAPCDGWVKALHAEVGDQVDEGQVLLVLTTKP